MSMRKAQYGDAAPDQVAAHSAGPRRNELQVVVGAALRISIADVNHHQRLGRLDLRGRHAQHVVRLRLDEGLGGLAQRLGL
ncbi:MULTISPECIES: hypothetical protein [unclassified Variovorax]|uniref:hypothetical protein n=1 Tax=unclassified Variovorax TaxID=663243 RepID=UPI0034E93963